jgi:predicted transglutaminase-like cysteine proteinase
MLNLPTNEDRANRSDTGRENRQGTKSKKASNGFMLALLPNVRSMRVRARLFGRRREWPRTWARLGLFVFIYVAIGGYRYWDNARHVASTDEVAPVVVADLTAAPVTDEQDVPAGDVVDGAPSAPPAQWRVDATAHDPAPLPAVAQAESEPFGLGAMPVASGEILMKWSGIEADVRAERDILARCRDSAAFCPATAQKFLAVIAEGRSREGRARIGVINRAINLAIRPASDLAQWGILDRWSTPLVTLATGRGDCGDYAIAKYVALREAGVAARNVRLVIVRDLLAEVDHAVVAARLQGQWMVLDNRHLALVADTDLQRMVPLFVLDDDGVRQFAATTIADARRIPTRSAGTAFDSTARFSDFVGSASIAHRSTQYGGHHA